MSNLTRQTNELSIIETIRELKLFFERHFDKNWFYVSIEELPIDLKNIKTIRELIVHTNPQEWNPDLVERGIKALEAFIAQTKQYLLPVVKEKLGVSKLAPGLIVRDKNQYVVRRMLADNLPHNLEELARLTQTIQEKLKLALGGRN